MDGSANRRKPALSFPPPSVSTVKMWFEPVRHATFLPLRHTMFLPVQPEKKKVRKDKNGGVRSRRAGRVRWTQRWFSTT
jgi:hypothetical protein